MAPQGPGIQPEREFRVSKRKWIQAKSLSFAFIYFSESGLFKGLQPIQMKKSAVVPTRLPGCVRSVSSDFLLYPSRIGRSAGLGVGELIRKP
jgi:hypothetical protein